MMLKPADAPDPLADTICVLANLKAGRQERDRVDRIVQALRKRLPGDRWEVRRVAPAAMTDAARAAMREGVGTIAAAGGDGTVGAVAAALRGSDVRLGVIPLGTFNYFARSLGLPQEIESAVDVIAQGKARYVPVGDVNGRLFLNNASLGVYPAILRTREAIYARWGRSRVAAYWSVVRGLTRLRRSMRLRISCDVEACELRSPLAFIASNPYQLERLGLAEADAVRDGKLALLIAPESSRLDLAFRALRLGAQWAEAGVDFKAITAERIRVDAGLERRSVARDGERERIEGPFEFRMAQGAVPVLVP